MRLKDNGVITAKIIDLGLAKAVNESSAQTAISTPGVFAGTPEFASPEQFGGVGVDIRSDLYSLGVTLWMMFIGKPPFRGTPGEVMYQHQQRHLPLEQLKLVPPPLVTLLEALLEKDPAKRPQTPAELLKAMPRVASAIDSGRKIIRQSLQNTSAAVSRARTRKPSPIFTPKKISIGKIHIILGNSIRIRSFVNTLVNSSGVNKPRLGGKAIGGSTTVIAH